MIESLLRSMRSQLKRPVFTATVILTLALGIGANTALFSVFNAVVLQPLPYEEPDRLVMVWLDNRDRGVQQDLTSYPNFLDWREQNRVFEGLAAFISLGFTVTGDEAPERVQGMMVAPGFFEILGDSPVLGRRFASEEEILGRDLVVILGHGLWQRRYGGEPSVLGTTLEVDGKERTVVGVMPPDFEFFAPSELWLPLSPDGVYREARLALWLRVIGRLRPEVSLGRARQNMDGIGRNLEEAYPASNQNTGIYLIPLHDQVVGDVQTVLWVLYGTVIFVLLIACANVANLQLTHYAAREKELGIRIAIGAGHLRLVRQLLLESTWLALLGGLAGLGLAWGGLEVLLALAPADIPRIDQVEIDGAALGYTFLISLVTGVLFGLMPALWLSDLNLSQILKEGHTRGLGGAGSGRAAVGKLSVVMQVALVLVLLIGAALMITSLGQLQRVDPGFRPAGLLSLEIELPPAEYPEPVAQVNFFWSLLEGTRGLPVVESAGLASSILVEDFANTQLLTIEGQERQHGDRRIDALVDSVSPGYFRTMGIELVEGRDFSFQDHQDSTPAVIINQAMARRHWPAGDALGKRVKYGGSRSRRPWMEIVGVVGDIRRSGLDQEVRPATYRAMEQQSSLAMSLVVRSEEDRGLVVDMVREFLALIDPNLTLSKVSALDQLIARPVAEQRFTVRVLSLFAAVALLLSIVGIYGVLSYLVSLSTRQFGIRLALGARRQDLLWLVLRQGMTLVGVGIALGLVVALGVSRWLPSLLFGVSATDPVIFVGVVVLVTLVALVASWLPARRAMDVDPMVVLRFE